MTTSTSFKNFINSEAEEKPCHEWLEQLLGVELPPEGGRVVISGWPYVLVNGILRSETTVTGKQQQTSDSFGFKWHKRDTYESTEVLAGMRSWLLERYGDVASAHWWRDYQDRPLLLDAGCGAAMSVLELFKSRLPRLRYLGVDISEAVDVAAARLHEYGIEGNFLQSDLSKIPLPDGSVDVLFSEGVLHHTDSTENALKSLVRYLRTGGRFLFYVYKKKGPIREYTDDTIREKLQKMGASEAWEKLIPLTKLGKALGDLNIEIEVPEKIDLLDIPAGKISLQRFVYWHVFKAFYRSDLSIEEMNHINFDWFAPANAHRQTPDEVMKWCEQAGLEIEKHKVEDAGITIIARKAI